MLLVRTLCALLRSFCVCVCVFYLNERWRANIHVQAGSLMYQSWQLWSNVSSGTDLSIVSGLVYISRSHLHNINTSRSAVRYLWHHRWNMSGDNEPRRCRIISSGTSPSAASGGFMCRLSDVFRVPAGVCERAVSGGRGGTSRGPSIGRRRRRHRFRDQSCE